MTLNALLIKVLLLLVSVTWLKIVKLTLLIDVKELIDIMKEAGQEVPDWMVAEASR